MTFQAEAIAKSGIQNSWTIKSYKQTAECSVPPEFNGPGKGFSPEDLYAQALTNCFIGTFKVYAENSKLTFDDLKVETSLEVNLNENKKVVMKSCQMVIQLANPSQADKAELLVKKTFESGFILNSVKTEINYQLHIQN